MDYTPRYTQPFTLQEATALDVGVITEEIARLQNSLSHLKETQAILKADMDESEEVDPDISKAFEENQVVIASQKERISILKMALSEKGVRGGAHYDPLPVEPPQTAATPPSPTTGTSVPSTISGETPANEEDDGVYL